MEVGHVDLVAVRLEPGGHRLVPGALGGREQGPGEVKLHRVEDARFVAGDQTHTVTTREALRPLEREFARSELDEFGFR